MSCFRIVSGKLFPEKLLPDSGKIFRQGLSEEKQQKGAEWSVRKGFMLDLRDMIVSRQYVGIRKLSVVFAGTELPGYVAAEMSLPKTDGPIIRKQFFCVFVALFGALKAIFQKLCL